VAASQVKGLFASVVHEAPIPSQVKGLFASVVHEAPIPSQVKGLFASVVHEAPIPSQVKGLFTTVVHDYVTPSQVKGLFASVVHDFVQTAVVPDISGSPAVLATFDGSGSQNPTSYTWTWTSLPGGSAIANALIPFPDSGATTPINMTDNEGLWHFEDVATDSSGNSHTLTLYNSPTYVTGKVGAKAMDFNGSNQYADVDLGGDAPAADGTIAAWFNLDNLPSDSVIAALGTTVSSVTGEWRAIALHNGGKLAFFGRSTDIYNIAALVTGQWYHAVITWANTDDVVVYLDGVQVASQTISGLQTPKSTFAIAGRTDAGSYYTDCQVDEVAVWSRALSATEVAEIYDYQSTPCAGPKTATLGFTPDIAGTYTVQLTVADGVSTTADAVISAVVSGPDGISKIINISKDNIGSILGISYGDIDKINDID
jgi:hypothetical protein